MFSRLDGPYNGGYETEMYRLFISSLAAELCPMQMGSFHKANPKGSGGGFAVRLVGGTILFDARNFRYLLVYASSGSFGFVLGGNCAPSGISSTEASGALFAVIALVLLDPTYHWGPQAEM